MDFWYNLKLLDEESRGMINLKCALKLWLMITRGKYQKLDVISNQIALRMINLRCIMKLSKYLLVFHTMMIFNAPIYMHVYQ